MDTRLIALSCLALIVVGGCKTSDDDAEAKRKAYAEAMKSVVTRLVADADRAASKEKGATKNSQLAESAEWLVSDLNAIDLHDCPAEFQDAFRNFIRVVNKGAEMYRKRTELKAIFLSQADRNEEEKAIEKEMNSAMEEIGRVAQSYGIKPKT